MIIDDFSKPKLTVVEGSAANDYFTRRKSEEDRIAGVKAPAKNKKNPANTDYAKKRKQQDIEESRPFRGTGGAFNRGDDERHDLDPSDWYIVKDGKMFRVSIYPRQVAQAEREGYSRTQAEAKAAAGSQGVAEGSGGNWYIRVNGKILNDTKFKPMIFSSEDEARSYAMKLADKKRIPLSQIKLTKSWMDAPEQGVAEGYPKHQDLSGISTDKLKAYLDKQSKQQVSGEGNQVKRVRAELQRREQSLSENAEDLHIGDPVIITGNGIKFEGATGEIVDFGRDNRFVVVNLYNHGRHSFHSSDVSFNEYAGSDDEEARMYDAGEFGDDDRDEMDEARTSAAQRLSTAWDKQRAKSDASLRRTPSSIPKKEEPKKAATSTDSKTMRESRVQRQALMAQMLNNH